VSTATVRKAEEADIPSLIRMQQSSAVRFERSADDWRAHLRSGFIMCAPADTWLVEWPEGPAAYLGVQRGSKERAASVQEYGGSTMAVIHGLAAAAGEAARIDVLRMPGDYTFPLLGATAENRPQRAFGGTVKIIDPPRFFDSIQDVLFERGGEEVADGLLLAADLDRVTFEWEGHEMDVPTAELSRLVFGAGPGDPPFEMSEGPLESLLPRLFPIPLPCYGYNYI